TALPCAVRRALFELSQIHEPLRRKHEAGAAAKLEAYDDVRTLEDHAAYVFRRDHVHEFDFLLRNHRPFRAADARDFSTGAVEAAPAGLARAARAAGCRALAVDVTTPDLDDYPIRVVRALVTQVQPIHFGHANRRLGGRRLYELPVALGYADAPVTEFEL